MFAVETMCKKKTCKYKETVSLAKGQSIHEGKHVVF